MLNEERAKTARLMRGINLILVVLAVFLLWRSGAPPLLLPVFGVILLVTIIDHHTLAVFTLGLVVLCIFLWTQDEGAWRRAEFRFHDRNKDNVLTAKEYDGDVEFNVMDRNGDGKIDLSEYESRR